MQRIDFLEQLQEGLAGQVSTAELREQINYYSQYIDDEVAKGASEEAVLDDLGDPWAIAHNILDDIERREGKEAARREQAERDAASDWNQAAHDTGKESGYTGQQGPGGGGSYLLVLLIAVLIIVVIVGIVLTVLGTLARSFPLLFVIIIILWAIRRLRS